MIFNLFITYCLKDFRKLLSDAVLLPHRLTVNPAGFTQYTIGRKCEKCQKKKIYYNTSAGKLIT